jgi:hypothetical protein
MIGTVRHNVLISSNHLIAHHDLVRDINPCVFPSKCFHGCKKLSTILTRVTCVLPSLLFRSTQLSLKLRFMMGERSAVCVGLLDRP